MKRNKIYLSLIVVVAIMRLNTITGVYADDIVNYNDEFIDFVQFNLITEKDIIGDNVFDDEELLPTEASGCPFNSLNLLSTTQIGGYTVTMDLELGGNGYNIHMRVNGAKYYYDLTNNCWDSNVPNKLIKNQKIIDALNHGLERIESGWH